MSSSSRIEKYSREFHEYDVFEDYFPARPNPLIGSFCLAVKNFEKESTEGNHPTIVTQKSLKESEISK